MLNSSVREIRTGDQKRPWRDVVGLVDKLGSEIIEKIDKTAISCNIDNSFNIYLCFPRTIKKRRNPLKAAMLLQPSPT